MSTEKSLGKPPENGVDKKSTTKSEPNFVLRDMYEVTPEPDGSFSYEAPGLVDLKRGYFVGTRTDSFATREEAEVRAAESREHDRILSEQMSLRKTYPNSLYDIKEADGKFLLTMPRLYDSKSGNCVGLTLKNFDTWDETKKYFLKHLEDREELSRKPLLELNIAPGERISFSSVEAFDPQVAPSEHVVEIPDAMKKYLDPKTISREWGNYTYRKTAEEKDWEPRLYSFISNYLQGGGSGILKELNIERLDALTPKQAIELSTRIVIDLTKYDHSAIPKKKGEEVENPADNKTALEILKDGRYRSNDKKWRGNGVCRNFAGTVQAVFEVLKLRQTTFSRLNNTYCFYSSGMAHAPERQRKSGIASSKPQSDELRMAHAWNTFVTFSHTGGAVATVADVTWANRNLETKQVTGLDYTFTRMEPIVSAIAKDISVEGSNQEELNKILNYYLLKLEGSLTEPVIVPPVEQMEKSQLKTFIGLAIGKLGRDKSSKLSEEELIKVGYTIYAEEIERQKFIVDRPFFVEKAVNLMLKNGVPKNISPELARIIFREYEKIADDADVEAHEIELLYKIYKTCGGESFFRTLTVYLDKFQLNDNHVEKLLFKDNDFQIAVYERIKTCKEFSDFFDNSGRFRIRMREVMPKLFFDFSPGTKVADARELKDLIDWQNPQFLSSGDLGINKPSEEKYQKFMRNSRDKLRKLDSDGYEKVYAGFDNYNLIKMYNEIYKKLSKSGKEKVK